MCRLGDAMNDGNQVSERWVISVTIGVDLGICHCLEAKPGFLLNSSADKWSGDAYPSASGGRSTVGGLNSTYHIRQILAV